MKKYLLLLGLSVIAHTALGADWFTDPLGFFSGGDKGRGKILLAENAVFSTANPDIAWLTLFEILQAVSGKNGDTLSPHFVAKGTRWRVSLPSRPDSPPSAEIEVIKVTQTSSYKELKLRCLLADTPLTITYELTPIGVAGSRLALTIKTPGVSADALAGAMTDIIFSNPFSWPLDLIQAESDGKRKRREGRRSARAHAQSFLRIWKALSEAKARDPRFSLDDFFAFGSKGLSHSVLLRSPYGSSLPTLETLIRTAIQNRRHLMPMGIELTGEAFSLQSIGSRFRILAPPFQATVEVAESSDHRIVFAVDSSSNDLALPRIRIAVAEIASKPEFSAEFSPGEFEVYRSPLEMSEIQVRVEIDPTETGALFFDRPDAVIDQWNLLQASVAKQGTASVEALFFEFWADLASRMSSAYGRSHPTETCLGALLQVLLSPTSHNATRP